MLIEELVKQNDKWKRISLKICKDYDLANDVLQQAYIKAIGKDVNEYYFTLSIKYGFIDHVRKQKDLRLNGYQAINNDSTFSPDDKEQKILDKFKKEKWLHQELIQEHYDRSYREIEKEFNICYHFAYRTTTKAIKNILGDAYEKTYKNTRKKS